jgi:uncharacterized protein (TIGR02145 family)
MKKIFVFGLVVAMTCLVACNDDSSTNTPAEPTSSSEVDVVDDEGTEENQGTTEESSSSVGESTESSDESSSSSEASETVESSSSSSVESSAESSSSVDPLAGTVWSWDIPRGKFLSPSIVYSTYTDEENQKTYKVMEYHAKRWIAENLNRDVEGSWCYDSDPAKCDVAGRLYTWDAAMNACPDGWRLPSDEDWSDLGGSDLSTAGKKIKSKIGWTENNQGKYFDYNGTDNIGFSAIPAGLRNNDDFANAGAVAFFWSSTEKNDDEANSVSLSIFDGVDMGPMPKNFGFSVRCVQDKSN